MCSSDYSRREEGSLGLVCPRFKGSLATMTMFVRLSNKGISCLYIHYS